MVREPLALDDRLVGTGRALRVVDAERGRRVALRVQVDHQHREAAEGRARSPGSPPWWSSRRRPSGWPRRRCGSPGERAAGSAVFHVKHRPFPRARGAGVPRRRRSGPAGDHCRAGTGSPAVGRRSWFHVKHRATRSPGRRRRPRASPGLMRPSQKRRSQQRRHPSNSAPDTFGNVPAILDRAHGINELRHTPNRPRFWVPPVSEQAMCPGPKSCALSLTKGRPLMRPELDEGPSTFAP